MRTIEQMKDDFTHNMTHELKTPVAVAYSAADSMLRYYDQSDEQRNKKYLAIIMPLSKLRRCMMMARYFLLRCSSLWS